MRSCIFLRTETFSHSLSKRNGEFYRAPKPQSHYNRTIASNPSSLSSGGPQFESQTSSFLGLSVLSYKLIQPNHTSNSTVYCALHTRSKLHSMYSKSIFSVESTLLSLLCCSLFTGSPRHCSGSDYTNSGSSTHSVVPSHDY